MKKKIWIWNHYASDMYKDRGGRHYSFAKYLVKRGYRVTIFCSNTFHKSTDTIPIDQDEIFTCNEVDGINFIFIKTSPSIGNGLSRVKNMYDFYKNVKKTAKILITNGEKVDCILASSVHPLTMLAGVQISQNINVPIICEVRDLWPETLVEMGKISRQSILTRGLYLLEKYIYKNANRLIFTMPGGKEYVENIGLNSSHVRHLNNGLDLEEFNYNKNKYIYNDDDLDNNDNFKVVYTGAMGQANELIYVLKAAELLKKNKDITFILFGDGYEREYLENYKIKNNINNIIFKGTVEKKYIPNILSKSSLNIFTGQNINLYKYGISLNKMFEYFGSGKPTISNINTKYDLLEKYKSGSTVRAGDPKALSDGILNFYNMSRTDYYAICDNALKAAKIFDYEVLTIKLENIFKELNV